VRRSAGSSTLPDGGRRFTLEHMMFGLVLGVLAMRTTPVNSPAATVRGAPSAMLSR